MGQPGNDRPPKWVLAFFRWFCHPELREYIEGDLLELYHHRRTGLGPAKAKWLFIKDVLVLFRPGIINNPNSGSQQFSIMKNIKWIQLVAINLLIVLMILSPFLPGPSNKLVLVFSISAQVLGYLGLALVPTGLTWTLIQVSRLRQANTDKRVYDRFAIAASLLIAFVCLVLAIYVPNPMPKVSFTVAMLLVVVGLIISYRHGAIVILAVTATASITFILLVVLLAVFVNYGILLGCIALLALIAGMTWLIQQIRKLRTGDTTRFRQLPIYLTTIPIVAFLVCLFLVRPASDFSRNYAIGRSETLIKAIEDYKYREGVYPESLEVLAVSIEPSIMGIDQFRYNRIHDHYSLSFSQWLDWGSLEEIVLYDKNNLRNNLTGSYANYDYKVDLWRVKGAFAVYNTGHPNWQYYHCD